MTEHRYQLPPTLADIAATMIDYAEGRSSLSAKDAMLAVDGIIKLNDEVFETAYREEKADAALAEALARAERAEAALAAVAGDSGCCDVCQCHMRSTKRAREILATLQNWSI